MKKIFFILLLPQILLAQTMQYKVAAVSEGMWTDPKQVDEVQKQVDRIVDKGFNVISIGTYKFMPSSFVDYEKTIYPEAQEMSAERIARNIRVLRENMRYAKSKGVKYLVSRSYSHYVPYNYWKAHQAELNPNNVFKSFLEKAHQNNIYSKTISSKKGVIPHQQWNNPIFRDFFLYSTDKMLDVLPELDGFLNAYAEASWTLDIEKVKANDWKSWKECIVYEKTDDNFIDYCNTLYALLKQKRKEKVFFGMRDWYVKQLVLERLEIPKSDLIISVKYGGYDQPVVGCPPWGKALQDLGYSVIVDMLVYDAEHPHPLYWYDNNVVSETFSNIYKDQFAGIAYQDFMCKGEDSYDNPIRLLTQETVGKAMKQQSYSDDEAIKFLSKYYKKGAEDVFKSLKSVAAAQENFIKLMPAWFWQGDGLTPGGIQNYRFWMLMDNPEAEGNMNFIRRDAVGVPEYVNVILKGKSSFEKDASKWKIENRQTPIEIIELMLKEADKAIEYALIAKKKSPSQSPYLRDIVASSFIHKELVLRQVAFLRASLAFYESGYEFDDKYNKNNTRIDTGVDKREECIKQMQLISYHDLVLAELCRKYAPRRPSRRGKNDFSFEKKVASVMNLKFNVAVLDLPYLHEIESKIK